MINGAGHIAEYGIRKCVTFTDCHGRQVYAVGNIAHGIDIIHCTFRKFVDLNCAVHGEFHAGFFKTKAQRHWNAACGKHNLSGTNLAAIFHIDTHTIARTFNALDVSIGLDFYALLFHLCCEMAAQIIVKAAQNLFAAID